MPSVDIIPYDSITMSDEIKSWLTSRFLDPSMVDDYPEDTWVSIHGTKLIAAAALGKSNTPLAFLFGLVTNPVADSELRHLSIDALTKQILKTSRYLGFKQVLAWTKDSGVLKRSFDHGFNPIHQIMMGIDLGEK